MNTFLIVFGEILLNLISFACIFVLMTAILLRVFQIVDVRLLDIVVRVMTYSYLMHHHRGYDAEDNDFACKYGMVQYWRWMKFFTISSAIVLVVILAAIRVPDWSFWNKSIIHESTLYLGLLAPYGFIFIYNYNSSRTRSILVASFTGCDKDTSEAIFETITVPE